MAGFKLKVTPEMEALTEICKANSQMDTSLYGKYDVKRGLRDINGKGVLAGLTQISNIVSSKMVDGQSVPCEGELYYRGYNINDRLRDFSVREGLALRKLLICCCLACFPMRISWNISKESWRRRDLCPQILSGT